jgi:hypothetical protein
LSVKYWELNENIIDAVISIGKITWPAPCPPAIDWPLMPTGPKYAYFRLLGILANSVWNCSKEAASFICRCTVENDKADIRAGAVASLSQFFKEFPETESIVRTCANDDPESTVRAIALRHIGFGSSTSDEVKEFIKQRAKIDRSGEVRIAAIETLAYSFSHNDDEEINSLIKYSAIRDRSRNVRNVALRALYNFMNIDHETQIILKRCATQDAYEGCRRTAFLGFSQTLDVQYARLLASRDVDGLSPGLDPWAPISSVFMQQVATILNEPEYVIRALYERMSEEIPLQLEPST